MPSLLYKYMPGSTEFSPALLEGLVSSFLYQTGPGLIFKHFTRSDLSKLEIVVGLDLPYSCTVQSLTRVQLQYECQ